MEKRNISQSSPVVMKATSKLSSRGQVVIPAEIRKTLGLTEGDDLTFIVNQDGEVKVEVTKKYCKLAHYFRIPFSNYFGRIRK
ncbi:AbrB/MazE/SpoVT family DNA-binding domain-containing protein [Geobacillus sp. BMUD]|uniref:AbrB/MazE/SpoVT family DNA-binding domain-containing protein n=1 Tax=Geobacillus sp. BMUD TaxID=2508876 RepID=UPI001492167C|nr:AbrB/MazE/SpoVT family DNA-binding domain-containing protein [Geobacillus sp. BMUD]NNU84104.1 AbrB/MazE/SpoVT family DNA-binding domain-containing protein [Geobacillus sp. BMUD]